MPNLSQSDPVVQARKANLDFTATMAFVSSMDVNKSAIVALFPAIWRPLVSYVLWPFLFRIGQYVVGAIVEAVLTRLGKMTIKEVFDFIAAFQPDGRKWSSGGQILVYDSGSTGSVFGVAKSLDGTKRYFAIEDSGTDKVEHESDLSPKGS